MNYQKNEEILKQLKQAEEKIESVLWRAIKDSNHKVELQKYEEIRDQLQSFLNLPTRISQERDRILSYCLMRIDNALVELGESLNSVDRAREAFDFA